MMVFQPTYSLTLIYFSRSVPWYEQILAALNRGIGLQCTEVVKQ